MMNNLELMRKRLEYQGGIKQEDRMIKDKYRTFLKTLQFSYQGCDISLVQPFSECFDTDSRNNGFIPENPSYRALISPDKLKQNYDDKILSVDYSTGFGPGDVFRWKGTQSQWLIYLQALTEDAYFRGEIRRCRHIIKFRNKDGIPKFTWAAIRGPVETQIDSIQKNQVRLDVPKLTLNILIPRNEDTLSALDKRYYRFLFADKAWKVQTADSVSTKNIIELTAEEDYINEDVDNRDDELIGWIEKIDPNVQSRSMNGEIHGDTFIKPKLKSVYSVDLPNGKWYIKEKVPAYIESISNSDENKVEIIWNKMMSGQFTLVWTNNDITLEKIIVVESLF